MTDTDLSRAAHESKAWPFEEARKIVARLERRKACSMPMVA
jgi:lysyl-tRNA synthetase class 1